MYGEIIDYIRVSSFEQNPERQLEGKKRGAYKGRKKVLNTEQVQIIKQRIRDGDRKSQIARDFKISRETLYQYIR